MQSLFYYLIKSNSQILCAAQKVFFVKRKIAERISVSYVMAAKLPGCYIKQYIEIQNLASLDQNRSLRKLMFCL